MKNNPNRIMRKHVDKNWNVIGLYDITNTERVIFYKNEILKDQSLSFEDQRYLEDLKDSFEDGFNKVIEIDGVLYEVLKNKDFEIRREIEEYFNVTKDLLTINEVADRYDIKPDTLRSYITRGEVIPKDKVVKIGRQWFIDASFAAEKWGQKNK